MGEVVRIYAIKKTVEYQSIDLLKRFCQISRVKNRYERKELFNELKEDIFKFIDELN